MAYRDTTSFGFGLTPWVKRLLIANAAVFLLVWLVPGLVPWLEFAPARILTRPWTAITYAFVHAGFLHLLFNMLGLFFFGPPLEARWGPREFLKYYLVCALGGAALSIAFGMYGSVVGASAAVFGVMLAFAMNWPNAPIYFWGIFPIPAKWLVAILAAMSLFSALTAARDGVAHLAHLGGFIAGFLYMKFDDKLRLRLSGLKWALPSQKKKKFTVIPGGGTPRPAGPMRSKEEERLLDEVDRVLDKISVSGLASLTDEERRILDEVSRRYRRN